MSARFFPTSHTRLSTCTHTLARTTATNARARANVPPMYSLCALPLPPSPQRQRPKPENAKSRPRDQSIAKSISETNASQPAAAADMGRAAVGLLEQYGLFPVIEFVPSKRGANQPEAWVVVDQRAKDWRDPRATHTACAPHHKTSAVTTTYNPPRLPTTRRTEAPGHPTWQRHQDHPTLPPPQAPLSPPTRQA